ncbi:hypothetical protein BHM03_00018903 [Ensete ventricosum]|nr:hypothetical protein BHM03_00018903 [Ensete ventricosum]
MEAMEISSLVTVMESLLLTLAPQHLIQILTPFFLLMYVHTSIKFFSNLFLIKDLSIETLWSEAKIKTIYMSSLWLHKLPSQSLLL